MLSSLQAESSSTKAHLVFVTPFANAKKTKRAFSPTLLK
jgi:hypothetical protein